jgi:quercetin dioxygenase-like cupin family protein
MKIKYYADIEAKQYTGDAVKGAEGRVLSGKADGADKFCMRLFSLLPGGHTPRHAHDWEHEVFVHAGDGAVLKDGDWQPLKVGSSVFVPPNEEHQFKNTGSNNFVFVCVIPAGAPEL